MKLNLCSSDKNRKMIYLLVISFVIGSTIIFAKKSHHNSENNSPKKVYAIFANDNTSGITHAMFDTAVEQLQASGHTVDRLNLYDHATDMPFFTHSRTQMESSSFFQENKQRFLDADILLIVFPVYWYSVPGILKTWIDMLSGWSYTYESGSYAKPNHTVKDVIVLYACAQATSLKNSENLSAVEYQMSETFKFIGVDNIHLYGVENVYGLQPSDAQKHFEAIKLLCRNL